MKRILGMALVLGFVGALTVMAQEVKPGKVEVVDLGKDVKLEMVLIPAGWFLMGGQKDPVDPFSNIKKVEEPPIDQVPQHGVTLTKSFYMGKYEVTQEQWFEIMGGNPSREKGRKLPVTNVSWKDCQEFIKKLNAKTDGAYRLPTESEWEYACRAGTQTVFYFGDKLTKSDANYGHTGKSIAVGSYEPNDFGLYDMHGNVWEWCEDWYGGSYLNRFDSYLKRKVKHPNEYVNPRTFIPSTVKDPKGPATGESRVLRGGSFDNIGSHARSSQRSSLTPTDRDGCVGFRLARTP